MGAQEGVNCTDKENQAMRMKKVLPYKRPYLDTIIDGPGGDIVGSTWKLRKLVGVVVTSYL